MHTIKAEPISREAYAPFGVYYDYLNPEGYALEGGDSQVLIRTGSVSPARHGWEYSPIAVRKGRKKLVIKSVEYHTTSPEMILPLNDDMIIHVAPASGRNTCARVDKGIRRTEGGRWLRSIRLSGILRRCL